MQKTLFHSLTWRMFVIALTLSLGLFCTRANAQEKAKCIATTKAGTQCKISASAGSTYCHIHDPKNVKITCGAKTKAGTPCKHRVKAAGQRCSQHKG